MISCDLGRIIVLISIPLCYFLQINNLLLLYTIAFCTASFNTVFNIAFWSSIPKLISKEKLTSANSRLSMTSSLSETIGPSLAGSIISLMGAPLAVLIDALTYFGSALIINKIPTSLLNSTAEPVQAGILRTIREGIFFVFKNRILRFLLMGGLIWNFVHFFFFAVLVLYFTKTLKFSAVTIGFILAAAGMGAVIGSSISTRIEKLYSSGKILIITQITGIALFASIAFINAHGLYGAVLIGGFMFVMEIFSSVNNVFYLSIRHQHAPQKILARVIASMNLLTWGIVPFSASLSGFIASKMGMKFSMYVGGLSGLFFSIVWAWNSKFWNGAFNESENTIEVDDSIKPEST